MDLPDAAPSAHERLTWEHIDRLATALAARLPRDYDALLAIARGGLIPAGLLCQHMDIRDILVAAVMYYTAPGETLDAPVFLQFPEDHLLVGKRILVVDDVWDSGRTISAVRSRLQRVPCHFDIATLHYKPHRSNVEGRPDYYAEERNDWIVYPWDPAADGPS